MIRIFSLKTPNEFCAHPGSQIGILSIGLMGSAPAGIADDIDIGRPVGQPLIDPALPLAFVDLMNDPSFFGNDLSDLSDKRRIKGRRQGDRLRALLS